MKRIAVEEHFLTESYLDFLRSRKGYPRVEVDAEKQDGSLRLYRTSERKNSTVWSPAQLKGMLDLGVGRLREMDEAGVDMQVLSLNNPGVEVFDPADGIAMAIKNNNELAEVCRKHPARFAGFAAIPCQDPLAAAAELERAVKKLGLKGAKINSHVNGEYLDNKKYWPIFQKSQELGVPVYLHPREPPPDMLKALMPYTSLTGSMWGFGADTSLHAMRLILSGLFDEYPQLKIILGHLGEAFPFWLWRLDNRWNRQAASSDAIARKIKKSPGQYIRDNFYASTSGNFWHPALLCAYSALGADKILFAVDHPQEQMKEAVKFIETASIPDADKEKIFHLNAEKLLVL